MSFDYFKPSRSSLSLTEMFSFSVDPEVSKEAIRRRKIRAELYGNDFTQLFCDFPFSLVWNEFSWCILINCFSKITSIFWVKSSPQPAPDVDLALRHHFAHPSRLFQIFVSTEPSTEEVSLVSTLQCTVITTGILVVVGVSSLCTFKLLQWIRQNMNDSSLLQNVKSLIVNLSRPFFLHWRKDAQGSEGNFMDTSVHSAAMIMNQNASDRIQLCRRPSDLQILTNGSPKMSNNIPNRLYRSGSRESSLERRLLTKDRTPLADCDIASGEEDINDIQGQYFGPTVKSSTICMELMGSSPEDSPVHALSPSKQQQGQRLTPKKGRRVDHEPRESYC